MKCIIRSTTKSCFTGHDLYFLFSISKVLSNHFNIHRESLMILLLCFSDILARILHDQVGGVPCISI